MKRQDAFRVSNEVERVRMTTYAHSIFHFIDCIIEPTLLFDIFFRVFCGIRLGDTIYCRPNACERNFLISSACCQNLPKVGYFDRRLR